MPLIHITSYAEIPYFLTSSFILSPAVSAVRIVKIYQTWGVLVDGV
jgi:hypothetical protein